MRRMLLASLLATACGGCIVTPLMMRSTLTSPPTPAQLSELWEDPKDIATRNLFDGPWGKELAPRPAGTYTVVTKKTTGVSPGWSVRDEHGVEWSVKQGAEAKVEVVTSRVLSAVGYHQPPVYYLARWTVDGGRLFGVSGPQSEARFRPKHDSLKDTGVWSWQENPFIGTRPYNGLRVLMMILNESDLKNENNTLYDVKGLDRAKSAPHRWYVVRDLGTALGDTERLNPQRNDPALFQKTGFINGVVDGAVDFNYHGRHSELANHITPQDVRWMCDLLARLSLEQWRDAFRAAGYDAKISERFIARIGEKIAIGEAFAP